MQHRVVGQTAARLRKDVSRLYHSTPQLTSLQQQVTAADESQTFAYSSSLKVYAVQFGRRCYASSQAGFTWGHKLPAKVQAAAGIAAEVEHGRVQQQSKQEQSLPESLMLQPPSGSSHKQITGAFARLPMVPISTEIIESALKRAGRVAANKKLKNEAQKARSRYNPPQHDLHGTLAALTHNKCCLASRHS